MDWLTSDRLALEGREIALPSSQGHNQIRWERKASGTPGQFETLPWPSTEASLPSRVQNQQEPQGHMIASRLPSFVTFYAAAVDFFGFANQPIGGSIQPYVAYRHPDLSGRINRVRIADDGVDVDIEGHRLDGLMVELAGDRPGPTYSVRGRYTPSYRHISTSTMACPSGSWVLLKDGEHWVDRRFLSHPFPHGGASEDVEYVVDPGTKLEVFLHHFRAPRS